MLKILQLPLVVFFLLVLPVAKSSAGRLSDGTVFFDSSPRLLNFNTTFQGVRVWGAKYYATIDLPREINEPLQTVTITQQDSIQKIDFDLNDTFAFIGTPGNRGKPLTIKSVTRDPDSNTISVVFDPPVPAGNTFSIGFLPVRNPDYSGIYQFRVNVYPFGEKTAGLSLGVGRLTFFDAGDRW